MQTLRLRAIQQPSHTEGLLASLVPQFPGVHPCARPLVEHSLLPSVLQRLARQATQTGHSWGAWTDGFHIWFFTAESSLALSRERGCPVLHVRAYRDNADLGDSSYWVLGRDGTWRRGHS
jgi:hypothetical protein